MGKSVAGRKIFAISLFRPSLLTNCKLQNVYLQMRRILICTAQPENIPYRQRPWDEIFSLFENLATNQSCLISNQLAYRLCPLWGISIISKAIEPFISYCICKKKLHETSKKECTTKVIVVMLAWLKLVFPS